MRFFLLGFVGLLALVWLFAPREPSDLTIDPDQFQVGSDVDAYLATREQQFDDVVVGVQKQVIWAKEPGIRTPLSIVYIHGFTATSQEIRPVPDRVAKALGANLYLARLTGHGRSADALAEASIDHWMRDVSEALKVGTAIGQRLIVMGTSTGGTLTAALAQDQAAIKNIAGFVFISPNFAINNRAATLLTWPFARHWVPLIIGDWQQTVPRNDLHARYWTTDYPTVALMPMAALVKAVDDLDFAEVDVPALFFYSPKDQVVVAEKIAEFAKKWGGPHKTVIVDLRASDDIYAHIIAGDIVSPAQTQIAVDEILAWIRAL